MTAWIVPGYDLERQLASEDGGELWLARDRSTLETVSVRVWTADRGVDPDAVRRHRTSLRAVRHPHLVAVRAVLAVEGGVALVSDVATGRSLADLLAARGRLPVAEVLTVGVPLAAALAALHSRSLLHGAVSARSVRLTDDGRPMLADLGVLLLADGGVTATAADDVSALAQVLRGALGSELPAELHCLDLALSPEPAERPAADQLARDLWAAGSPAPLRLVGERGEAGPVALRDEAPAAPTAPPPPAGAADGPLLPPQARRRSRRPSLMVAAVPLALAAAVLAGRAWAAADRPPDPPPLPSASLARMPAAPTDWSSLLTTLDTRRDAALANLDVGALREVYAEGSAPLAVDVAAIRAMSAARAHPDGLRLEIESVRVLRRTPERTTLQVIDRLPPYDLVAADGRLLERRAGRGPVSWLVELVPAGAGWRITGVTRA